MAVEQVGYILASEANKFGYFMLAFGIAIGMMAGYGIGKYRIRKLIAEGKDPSGRKEEEPDPLGG